MCSNLNIGCYCIYNFQKKKTGIQNYGYIDLEFLNYNNGELGVIFKLY